MYSFEGRIRYSECDATGRLSPVALINYLQDCSTFQSAGMAPGLPGLAERGLAWALAAWQVEIDELPAFGTRVTTSTWCYAMRRTHALRCFEMTDARGRSLARADSQWLVFDTASGTAARVPDDQRAYVSDEPRLDMAPFERRLDCAAEGLGGEALRVREHHLDTNRHVNNAQYVLLALDALADLGHAVPLGEGGRLNVQYRRMARLGDPVVPVAHACAGGWVVDLTDGQGSTWALVRAQGVR